jgi:hypothetical protein
VISRAISPARSLAVAMGSKSRPFCARAMF